MLAEWHPAVRVISRPKQEKHSRIQYVTLCSEAQPPCNVILYRLSPRLNHYVPREYYVSLSQFKCQCKPTMLISLRESGTLGANTFSWNSSSVSSGSGTGSERSHVTKSPWKEKGVGISQTVITVAKNPLSQRPWTMTYPKHSGLAVASWRRSQFHDSTTE